ncbi:DUF3617 domain-containing protein [Agrilutibacter solisilvae]|uniref:DUF3617 domain-containing protein n=1 Tax=Agrilutibacter solisilvae TaxID=2763317 RepID=A0A974XZL3_9GAMM|nr:DUF3617 family protein [Lysobacter solisilvae]QSX78696.1 DUF3617 domain-containing protein [Lysobacter solisilvae]
MNRKTLIAGLLGGLTLCAAEVACADAAFLPGLYEVRVSYPSEGAGVETTRECLTAAEARQESLEWRLAEVVEDTSCKFTQRSIAGGRFAIAGTCNNQGFRSTLKQSGTYSPTTMTMDMSMTMQPMPGAEPVAMRMVMSSRRVAANCPAGSDKD